MFIDLVWDEDDDLSEFERDQCIWREGFESSGSAAVVQSNNHPGASTPVIDYCEANKLHEVNDDGDSQNVHEDWYDDVGSVTLVDDSFNPMKWSTNTVTAMKLPMVSATKLPHWQTAWFSLNTFISGESTTPVKPRVPVLELMRLKTIMTVCPTELITATSVCLKAIATPVCVKDIYRASSKQDEILSAILWPSAEACGQQHLPPIHSNFIILSCLMQTIIQELTYVAAVNTRADLSNTIWFLSP